MAKSILFVDPQKRGEFQLCGFCIDYVIEELRSGQNVQRVSTLQETVGEIMRDRNKKWDYILFNPNELKPSITELESLREYVTPRLYNTFLNMTGTIMYNDRGLILVPTVRTLSPLTQVGIYTERERSDSRYQKFFQMLTELGVTIILPAPLNSDVLKKELNL
jgi:hypothetical protein